MENASCSALELGKKMLGKQGNPATDGSIHEHLLAFGGNEPSGPPSSFWVGPTADTKHTAAGHLGYSVNAAANRYNTVGRFHHAPNSAIIAPKVKGKCCVYHHYSLLAKSATSYIMSEPLTSIDRHWLRERLKARGRGSQARLAEHLGLQSNVMSKIMNGTRAIQQDEIPKVLEFFNARIVLDDASEDLQQLLKDAGRLNNDGLQLLRNQLNGMLQTPSLLQSRENTEPEG